MGVNVSGISSLSTSFMNLKNRVRRGRRPFAKDFSFDL